MRCPLIVLAGFALLQGCLDRNLGFVDGDGELTVFELRLNTAGDDTLLDELDRLEVEVIYPDQSRSNFVFGGMAITSELTLESITPGEGAVFGLRGFAGEEEIAVGDSPPVSIEDGLDGWALLHRHGVFLPLDGDGFTRVGHQVVPVAGGAVVIGGDDGRGFAPLSELVRTETAGYELIKRGSGPQLMGSMATRIRGGEMDGQVFLGGGMDGPLSDSDVMDEYWVWDPDLDSFSTSGDLMESRSAGSAVAIGAGLIALTGGVHETGDAYVIFAPNVELVELPTKDTYLAHSGEVRWFHSTAASSPLGAVSCGGYTIDVDQSSMVPSDSCDVYDAPAGEVQVLSQVLAQPRGGAASVPLGDDGDRLLLVGGIDENWEWIPGTDDGSSPLSTAEIVSLPGPTARPLVEEMVSPRAFPAAVRVAQDRALICGGHDGYQMLRSCEIFDEQTETFEIAENLELQVPASAVVAAALDDGSVLWIGGNAGQGTPAANGLIYLP